VPEPVLPTKSSTVDRSITKATAPFEGLELVRLTTYEPAAPEMLALHPVGMVRELLRVVGSISLLKVIE
jgi:hypothetical protein